MGGEAASSPTRSELAPLEGRGSPGPGSPAREALRRALNGDDQQPNLALAPLRWNIEKERRARGAALASAEAAFDAEADRRRAGFDASKRARDHAVAERRAAAQRDGLKVAPKRFDRARQAIATLRRVGNKKEASRRTRKLREMERNYWQQVSGVQFEAAEADATRAEARRVRII